jgi:hypothetical protein
MATVFMSYSHKDEELRDQLEAHLALLKNQGLVETWHDRRILAGEEFDNEIFDNEAFTDVAKQTRRHVEQLPKKTSAEQPAAVPQALPPEAKDWSRLLAKPTPPPGLMENLTRLSAQHRSSNLRLKKEFSEKDKADFVRETFEYICRFFEGSVEAIGARNADVEGRFERIDKRTMTAVLYRSGKTIAQCSVRLDGTLGGDLNVVFSHDASLRSSSFNDMLSVEVCAYGMGVRPMALSAMHGTHGTLSQAGAAEYLWGTFIREAQQ